MNNLKNVGRIVFAIPFAIFGLMHLMMANNMAGMVPTYVPGGVFWVYLTGLALVAATISIISKKQILLSISIACNTIGRICIDNPSPCLTWW